MEIPDQRHEGLGVGYSHPPVLRRQFGQLREASGLDAGLVGKRAQTPGRHVGDAPG